MRMMVLTAIWLAAAVTAADTQSLTKQVLQTKHASTVFYRAEDEVAVPSAGAAHRVVAAASAGASVSGYRRVFYTSERRSERNRFIATGNFIVRLHPGISPETFAAAQGLTLERVVNARAGIYLFAPSSDGELISRANRLNALPEVDDAEPEWIKPVLLR